MVLSPSRWSAWRVLPSYAEADVRSDMCIHGICHILTAMPGLSRVSHGERGGQAEAGCIV